MFIFPKKKQKMKVKQHRKYIFFNFGGPTRVDIAPTYFHP